MKNLISVLSWFADQLGNRYVIAIWCLVLSVAYFITDNPNNGGDYIFDIFMSPIFAYICILILRFSIIFLAAVLALIYATICAIIYDIFNIK